MNQHLAILKSERLNAILLLVLTAVLWSIGGLFIKWVDWHPLAIAGSRSAIAGLVLAWCFRQQPLSCSKVQLAGAAAYASMVMMFVTATKLTTAANAILLQYTAPIFVALLGAWLLGERATRLDWLTILAALGGMVLFFQDNMTAGNFLGTLLGIGSGLSLALFAMMMRKQKNASPHGSVLLGNALTFLCGLPFMFAALPSWKGWAALLILGVFQLGFSYVLYSVAIKHVTALEATLITIIEPILNPVWVFLMIGETPGAWSLAGGVIIILAISARGVIAARAEGGSTDPAA